MFGFKTITDNCFISFSAQERRESVMKKAGQRKRCLTSFAKGIRSDVSGAIAVETALIAPFVLMAMIVAGSMGITVYDHQKLSSAGYAGMSFLQDHMATGDYEKLRQKEAEDGTKRDGDLIRRAKHVIKDASGLPINLEDVSIEVFCGCPQGGPGQGEDNQSFDISTLSRVNPFYSKSSMDEAQSGGGGVCSTPCEDGEQSRIIAEIDLSLTSKNLLGNTETSHEKLSSRLR